MELEQAQQETNRLRAVTSDSTPQAAQSIDELLAVPDLTKYQGPDKEAMAALGATLVAMQKQMLEWWQQFQAKTQEASRMLASSSIPPVQQSQQQQTQQQHEDPRPAMPQAVKKVKGQDGAPKPNAATAEAVAAEAAETEVPDGKMEDDSGGGGNEAQQQARTAGSQAGAKGMRSPEASTAEIARMLHNSGKEELAAREAVGAAAAAAPHSS